MRGYCYWFLFVCLFRCYCCCVCMFRVCVSLYKWLYSICDTFNICECIQILSLLLSKQIFLQDDRNNTHGRRNVVQWAALFPVLAMALRVINYT